MQKKIYRIIFLLIFAMFNTCYGSSKDYTNFKNIEEVIEFETLQILNFHPTEFNELSSAYLDRGDSYILIEQFEKALIDFQTGYDIARNCEGDEKSILSFRALFGMALVYANMEMIYELEVVYENLKSILKSLTCSNCQMHHNSRASLQVQDFFSYKKMAKEIIGPDQIAISDCLEYAEGTARRARELICFVKRPEVQIILNIIIDDLIERARGCCRAGGVWKACLKPIVDKWALWDEKWRIFRTPPDPAWD